ncbi:MAG: Gldg family protein [Alphaproteobacteria bacterium]|nr:Gldg family protein [Alphaproteobacteria bacterium]
MQQFFALFKKEMNGYFKSYFAFMIFFIYLFVSIGCAFYFGAYLAMHDASVYALFYLQPVILALLIPALTMRLWSDEYKSGTAEFLLTQPLKNRLPVLAKFAAAGVFAVAMSLFLLPFIMYTATWLKIDWNNILCSYAGIWLYILLFCSLGCFISSLSKYTIISYLLTVFISALWLLLPLSKLYDVYNNFLFAEVGISDFLYFVISTAALLWLNVLVLDYRRSAQKNKNLRFGIFASLFVVGVVLLNSALLILFDAHKTDFTSDGQYTLQPKTRQIVSSVVKPITLDVYIAKDLKAKNAEYYYYYQQTKRFIEKYGKESASMISVNVTETEPFSELEKNVINSGLYYEENAKGTKDYFGAVIRDNEGQGLVIKQFLPQRRAFLEKDIDKALLKLTQKEVIKSIGIYFDPLQNLGEFNAFTLNLEEDYNILNVTDDTYEISSKLDLLILVNPKEMPLSFLYAIDQYIANGGKVLIFFDLLTNGQSENTNMKTLQVVAFLDQMNVLLGEDFTDEGTAAGNYKVSEQKLKLYKALTFTATDSEFEITPVIENTKGFIGAVLRGQYKSVFETNPHQSKEILSSMMPHTIYSSETATVAFVGDADIIENETWVADGSPDTNPYSVINKSANMLLLRKLIDELAGNDIYNELPQKNDYESLFGIGEQVNAEIFGQYYEEYGSILEDMKMAQLKLLQKSGGDEQKLQTMMQLDEAGLALGQAEQKMENLFYQIRRQYSSEINEVIAINVFAIPVLSTIFLWLAALLVGRYRLKKIKELSNE